jgi:3-oxoacyl-[acyl-carrier protein] reductase
METKITAPHAGVARGQRLDHKVAIVTGAGGELGHRVAMALGGLGASVVLNHRGNNRATLAKVVEQLSSSKIPAMDVVADTAKADDVRRLFVQAAEKFGGVDLVVHTPGRVTKTPFVEISDEEFEASVNANVRAAFFVLRESARRVRDGGRIVTLTTSITGVTIPAYSIYAGHKSATEHYVRGLAKELGPRGITVNAVGPGPINSPFYFGVESEQSFQAACKMSGAGRLGEWDEIVPLVAFLCTPDAHWITAQTIRINGGMTA